MLGIAVTQQKRNKRRKHSTVSAILTVPLYSSENLFFTGHSCLGHTSRRAFYFCFPTFGY